MSRGDESYRTITAVILAGGLGTRLRSVVPDTQKVVAPVGGRPFLDRHFETLVQLGIKKAVLCTGYKSEQVQERYGTLYRGISLSYSIESTPLGTGGALGNAAPLISSSTVLIFNGDSIASVDYSEFLRSHLASPHSATLALFKVKDAQRYGRVETDAETGRILSFQEKSETPNPGWVNGGVYLIAQDLLAGISSKRPLSLEREVFPAWISLRALRGFCDVQGSFFDIGTPESYQEANSVPHPLTVEESSRAAPITRGGIS